MKKKEIRTNGIWGAKIWFTKGRFVFFFHLVSQGMVRIFLTNYTVKWVKTDETPDLFLYWLSNEAEGVLSVLMQTAYSYADAEQFRNKNAFVIYFSMYQDWKRKACAKRPSKSI